MSAPQIFDRTHLALKRARAARTIDDADFLLKEMADRLSERLAEINQPFDTVLDLGGRHGLFTKAMQTFPINQLVHTDISHALLCHPSSLPCHPAPSPCHPAPSPCHPARVAGSGATGEDTDGGPRSPRRAGMTIRKLVCDEEYLPFADNVFDLVVACGSLQWVNDVPGTLIQINRCLKPGGLLVAMLPGGQTLRELRHAFEQSEIQHTGGLSPRIAPFIDIKETGSLLSRAGFVEPVSDSDMLTVRYSHPLALLSDLRRMGSGNIMHSRLKHFTPRQVMLSMADYYMAQYGGEDGRVPATFELVTMTAWKA